MTEFKEGDRVKVEFEGVVEFLDDDGTWKVTPQPADFDEVVYISGKHMTKIAPALPTKVGSVIDSLGYRFMLTNHGWHPTTDMNPWPIGEFENTPYANDFTVVLGGN